MSMPPGSALGVSSSCSSEISASVVSISPAIDAAFCSAQRVTLAGSITPAVTRSSNFSVIVEKVRSEKNPNVGYNAATEKFEDLVAAGIIDPAKVTRCALQNAASIAGLMLTTEALISEIQEDDKPGMMSGGMGGGMGM